MTRDSRLAFVLPTNIPGLVDVSSPEGVDYHDLTMAQLDCLALKYGWQVQFVEPVDWPARKS